MDPRPQTALAGAPTDKEVHDFNNRLTGLLGLLSLARHMAGAGGELAEVLAQAEGIALKLGLGRPRRRTRPAGPAILAVLLSFLYIPAAGGGFKGLAKELTRDALGAGINRVAVLPFDSVDAGSSREGWRIAEDLTTQLVRAGKVQTVERTLLKKLLEEHSLAQTGIIAAASAKQLGAVLAADGIVSGSFVTMGGRIKVNARLIQVETGIIVSACEAEVDREIFDLPVLPDVSGPAELSPDLDAQADDASAAGSCADAAERVDRMEEMILELKARYWARRLRQGSREPRLKEDASGTLTGTGLRQRFDGRLRFWSENGAVPELTPAEVRRFVAIDQRAFTLHRECGLRGG